MAAAAMLSKTTPEKKQTSTGPLIQKWRKLTLKWRENLPPWAKCFAKRMRPSSGELIELYCVNLTKLDKLPFFHTITRYAEHHRH